MQILWKSFSPFALFTLFNLLYSIRFIQFALFNSLYSLCKMDSTNKEVHDIFYRAYQGGKQYVEDSSKTLRSAIFFLTLSSSCSVPLCKTHNKKICASMYVKQDICISLDNNDGIYLGNICYVCAFPSGFNLQV